MKPLLAAIGFLSVAPVPSRWRGGKAELGRSLPYFPVVGLLFGVAAGLLARVLEYALPPAPAAVLLVIVLALLTGGLHVDGLADTADGFFSSRPKERILEIMRDSRTGAMGAAAVVCVLLLKCSALAALSPAGCVRAAFLMPLAGRCLPPAGDDVAAVRAPGRWARHRLRNGQAVALHVGSGGIGRFGLDGGRLARAGRDRRGPDCFGTAVLVELAQDWRLHGRYAWGHV